MTWIKTKDLMPPTHEIILFQDESRNIHYGVLCGEFSDIKKREKYWCHIFNRTYKPSEIIYWCEIPINRHFIEERLEITQKVNKFLWDSMSEIEHKILQDFKEQEKENPKWDAESFVGIAVRNTIHRMIQVLRVDK